MARESPQPRGQHRMMDGGHGRAPEHAQYHGHMRGENCLLSQAVRRHGLRRGRAATQLRHEQRCERCDRVLLQRARTPRICGDSILDHGGPKGLRRGRHATMGTLEQIHRHLRLARVLVCEGVDPIRISEPELDRLVQDAGTQLALCSVAVEIGVLLLIVPVAILRRVRSHSSDPHRLGSCLDSADHHRHRCCVGGDGARRRCSPVGGG